MRASHRISPNRLRELRERVQRLVAERLGERIICTRCSARFRTYSEKCEADLAERCPGFNVVDRVQMDAEKEVGLT
jgi:ribosomal protein L40E